MCRALETLPGWLAALALFAGPAAAQTVGAASARSGMTISGDRELPVAAVALPWPETPGELPAVRLQSGLPERFEHDRSLAFDPLNRSVAVLHMAKEEAVEQARALEEEKAAAAKKRRRRARGDEE